MVWIKYSPFIHIFEQLVPSQFHNLVKFRRCGLGAGRSSVWTSFETMLTYNMLSLLYALCAWDWVVISQLSVCLHACLLPWLLIQWTHYPLESPSK